MKSSVKTAPWVVGTALLAVLVLAGAWFLGISPQLDAASENREQAEFERDRADLLRLQLEALRADFERMPEYALELEELQAQIPERLALAPLTRDVEATAARTGVHILAMNPSLPLPIEVFDTAPAPAPVEQASAKATEEGGDAAATATPPPPPAPTFFGTPIEVMVLGGYEAAFAFVREMQSNDGRLLLVTGIEVTAQEESGAAGGRPATQAGDVEVRVSLLAYTRLAPVNGSLPAGTGGTEPAGGAGGVELAGESGTAPLPVPAGGTNPFAAAQ